MKCNVPFREGVGVDKNYLMVASTQLSLSLSLGPFTILPLPSFPMHKSPCNLNASGI
jgi:hypothetical protein